MLALRVSAATEYQEEAGEVARKSVKNVGTNPENIFVNNTDAISFMFYAPTTGFDQDKTNPKK